MNPVVESLLGMKAFNDQFIAEELLLSNRLRMTMLLESLKSTAEEALVQEFLLQLTYGIRLEQSLLELGLSKEWLTVDPNEQLKRDLNWAKKACHLAQKR
ncbi:hypothetical protein ACTHPM_02200 [Paenibacillus sp. SAFN-054]